MKIEIKICDVVYTLEEARELYEELKKIFDKGYTTITNCRVGKVEETVFAKGGIVKQEDRNNIRI